jgi:DNA-binding protein
MEIIKIGKKKYAVYMKACSIAIKNDGDVLVVARGNNIPRAIIVSEIVKRKHPELSKYTLTVSCEEKEGKLIPTIEIGMKT